MTLTHSTTGLWVYNYFSEGSCFGPATEGQVKLWEQRTGPYINYNYFGYTQKVVLSEYRGCGDEQCSCNPKAKPLTQDAVRQ